jgi:DNA-binding NtrC family response regulator
MLMIWREACVLTRVALFLDIETDYSAALGGWCGRHQIRVLESHTELTAAVERRELVVAIVGLTGSDEAAFDRVRMVAKTTRGVPIVVLGRGLSGEMAFRCARLGIADVIDLPAAKLDVVARVAAHVGVLTSSPEVATLIGESEPMRALRREVKEAARVDSKVLLQGETGTGKGLVARIVHELSSRRAEPFVHVDCAALSPTLIESELFGHEKHSFTGAGGLRRGRFETAASGTIFLDEIGDLDGPLQSKLLRVLEDRVFERVGGSQSIPMIARVIAATCHDLADLVSRGRFRPDLYFRLNVIGISVPPLRDRIEDMPALARAAVGRLSETLGIPAPAIGDSFFEPLREHHWPGNVRELFNVIERILVRGRSQVLEADDLEGLLGRTVLRPKGATGLADGEISPDFRTAASPPELTAEEQADAARIAEALRETGGNVSRVSRRLMLARGTLRHRIHKYRLEHLVQKD